LRFARYCSSGISLKKGSSGNGSGIIIITALIAIIAIIAIIFRHTNNNYNY